MNLNSSRLGSCAGVVVCACGDSFVIAMYRQISKSWSRLGGGRFVIGRAEIRLDETLTNFFDHQFQVSPAFAFDQGTGPVYDNFFQASLNQSRQLETATNFVDDIITFQSFDHGVQSPNSPRENQTMIARPLALAYRHLPSNISSHEPYLLGSGLGSL